jgi:nitroreductase
MPMTSQIVALRGSQGADAREAWLAAVTDLHTLITLDPVLGASPVRVYFVLNPQAIARVGACVDADDRPRARSASALALVAYDFPFALRVVESNAPGISRQRGERIVIHGAGLQGEALRAAAGAMGIDARPLPAFDEGALKAAFFPDTQETVTHLFALALRAGAETGRAPERARPARIADPLSPRVRLPAGGGYGRRQPLTHDGHGA